jgi:hypothetical protein
MRPVLRDDRNHRTTRCTPMRCHRSQRRRHATLDPGTPGSEVMVCRSSCKVIQFDIEFLQLPSSTQYDLEARDWYSIMPAWADVGCRPIRSRELAAAFLDPVSPGSERLTQRPSGLRPSLSSCRTRCSPGLRIRIRNICFDGIDA